MLGEKGFDELAERYVGKPARPDPRQLALETLSRFPLGTEAADGAPVTVCVIEAAVPTRVPLEDFPALHYWRLGPLRHDSSQATISLSRNLTRDHHPSILPDLTNDTEPSFRHHTPTTTASTN